LKIIFLFLFVVVIMHSSRYGLRPRASSASSTERRPEPASYLESSPTEQVGSASPYLGGSLPHIELGDALSPQAGSQRDEVAEVDVSQYGQAQSSSIEASQVLATEDFSSSTPRDGTDDQIHPPDGDTTPIATQPPHLPLTSLSSVYMCQVTTPYIFVDVRTPKCERLP